MKFFILILTYSCFSQFWVYQNDAFAIHASLLHLYPLQTKRHIQLSKKDKRNILPLKQKTLPEKAWKKNLSARLPERTSLCKEGAPCTYERVLHLMLLSDLGHSNHRMHKLENLYIDVELPPLIPNDNLQ